MVTEDIRVKLLNGSLQNHNGCLAGKYRGYYTIVEQVDAGMLFSFSACSEFDKNNEKVKVFLAQKSEAEEKIQNYHAEENTVQIVLPSELETEAQVDFCNRMMDEVVDFLVTGNYKNCCSYCGKTEEDLQCYEINKEYYYICDTCSHEIQEDLQKAANLKSKFVPGIIGALLGSFVGCILWIVIYKLGYIAGIAGAAMCICAMKGYGLFGKKLDRKGVVVSTIIMVVMVFLSNRLAWSLEAYDAFQEYGYSATFAEIFTSIGDIIKQLELTADYYKDLIVGYALTVLCSASTMYNAFCNSGADSYSINIVE